MMKLHYGLLPIRDTQEGSETVFVVNETIELLSRPWPQLKVAAAVHSESNVFAVGLTVAVG